MASRPLAWINKRVPSTIICLALAVVFAAIAVYESSLDRRLQQHGVPTDAVVIDQTYGRYSDTTVRFTDGDGNPVEARLRKDEDVADIGALIPIVYDPQDPDVNSTAATVSDTSGIVYAGAAMSAFSLVLAILTWTRVIDWERWAKHRGY